MNGPFESGLYGLFLAFTRAVEAHALAARLHWINWLAAFSNYGFSPSFCDACFSLRDITVGLLQSEFKASFTVRFESKIFKLGGLSKW